MYNDLLTIGRFTIHGYGLMIAIGILAAYLCAEYRAKRQGLDPDRIWSLAITVVLAGIAGAKVLYYITDLKNIIADPSILLDFQNGFVVYGGILAGILAGWIYCRANKLDFLRYADLTLTSVALAQGFGRIGCFLAGCCYGVPTDSRLSIVFTHSDFAPNGVHLVPTQLYSSALNFLNFATLVLISKKAKTPGQVSACYLLFYSIGRFCIEFFRGDLIRGSVGILSTSQFISIWTGLAGAAVLVFLHVRSKKDPASL